MRPGLWPAGANEPAGIVGTRLWQQGPDPAIVEAQERGRAYGRRLAELEFKAAQERRLRAPTKTFDTGKRDVPAVGALMADNEGWYEVTAVDTHPENPDAIRLTLTPIPPPPWARTAGGDQSSAAG